MELMAKFAEMATSIRFLGSTTKLLLVGVPKIAKVYHQPSVLYSILLSRSEDSMMSLNSIVHELV